LKQLQEDFGELSEDVLKQRITELVYLRHDPRAARYYDDSGAGTLVLSQNAVYQYLLLTERDALLAARDKRIREAAANERNAFYDGKMKSTPKAFATAIVPPARAREIRASTPIPSRASGKIGHTPISTRRGAGCDVERDPKTAIYEDYLNAACANDKRGRHERRKHVMGVNAKTPGERYIPTAKPENRTESLQEVSDAFSAREPCRAHGTREALGPVGDVGSEDGRRRLKMSGAVIETVQDLQKGGTTVDVPIKLRLFKDPISDVGHAGDRRGTRWLWRQYKIWNYKRPWLS
jgi:hypothetical protein